MKKILFCILSFSTLVTHAQFGTDNEDLYAGLKAKTLYVPVADTSTAFAQQMMNTIKSNWTLCPVSFVITQNAQPLYKPGNFFVTLDHNSVSFTPDPNRMDKVKYNDYFYLNFWLVKDKFKGDKTPEDKDKTMLMRAELYLKSIGTGYIDYSKPDLTSVNFDREFCNGLPGYIKNIFQSVNRYMTDKMTVKLKKDRDPIAGLSKLQKDTLYVPNYWYGPGGTMAPNDKANSHAGNFISNMLGDYPYPIKLVRRDELSSMILAGRPIFYFNYVQSSADKMMSIVNAVTGEVMYYNFNDKSYTPKGSDFKDMGKAVKSAM